MTTTTLPVPTALKAASLGIPLLMLGMLMMLVVPLPPLVLDLAFTFNIALALVVMMVVIYTPRPMDFAVFPSVLLIATLLRLTLNVASTRVVLMNGHEGTHAAGRVIEAFGDFVVGGNTAVGLVVFAILVIINFVVVTKGAGRVSEVSARFTLDAMPGKQMAIDADLNSGLITQEQARARREEIQREANFYGSMDGASKFVRGDAVAGLLVLFINIIGGLAIGMSQHSLSFGVAAEQYTLLTVGDGLVAQIPALVLSTATAIIVTRAAHSQQMGEAVVEQLFGSPAALGISGGVMALLGLVPGMPNLAFLTLGAIGGGAAFLITQKRRGAQDTVSAPAPVEPAPEARDLSWDDVTPVDLIGLEVGYRLIPLVDRNQGGALMSRIKGVRKKLSQELGFLIQPIHIRDNLELAPNAYRITLLGVPVGEAEIHPERELAINPGRVFGVVPGIAAKDPAFNLDALWIESAQREQAQTLGYTVVDAATVVATHLSQLLQNHAHELLGHEEAQQLLDVLGRSVPKLVEDLVPKQLSLACVLKVLQNLLEEHIPVRDLRSIAETLAEHAARSQDPATLTAAVRVALGRLIVQNINGMAQELPVITLDPQLEQLLHQAVTGNGAGGFEPGLAERLHASLAKSAEAQELKGQPAVLLVGQALRPWLARLTRHSIQNLRVLAYEEVPDSRQVKVVASVGQ